MSDSKPSLVSWVHYNTLSTRIQFPVNVAYYEDLKEEIISRFKLETTPPYVNLFTSNPDNNNNNTQPIDATTPITVPLPKDIYVSIPSSLASWVHYNTLSTRIQFPVNVAYYENLKEEIISRFKLETTPPYVNLFCSNPDNNNNTQPIDVTTPITGSLPKDIYVKLVPILSTRSPTNSTGLGGSGSGCQQDKINVFLNNDQLIPTYTFAAGISLEHISRLFEYQNNMVIIGLKVQGENTLVPSPFNIPGNYTVVPAPILTINVAYKPFLRKVINKVLTFNPLATPEEVRNKILSAFDYNPIKVTEVRLMETNGDVVEMNRAFLTNNQNYELSIPFFSIPDYFCSEKKIVGLTQKVSSNVHPTNNSNHNNMDFKQNNTNTNQIGTYKRKTTEKCKLVNNE